MKTFNQRLAEKELPKNDAEHIVKDREMIAAWSDKMLLDAMAVAIDDAEKLGYLGANLCAEVRRNTLAEIEKRINVRKNPLRSAGEWAEFFCKSEDSDVYRQTVVAWVQRIQDDAINRNAPPLL